MNGDIKEISFTFDGVNDQQLVQPLDFLHVWNSDSNIKISFDGKKEITARQGSRFANLNNVSRVKISSTTAQTVIIKYSLGGNYSEQSAQIEIDPNTPTLPTHEEQSAGGTARPDVNIGINTAVVVLAGNALRRKAYITNLNNNLNSVRVATGGITPTAITGIELTPGMTLITENTGSISVYNTNDNTGGAESIGLHTEEFI